MPGAVTRKKNPSYRYAKSGEPWTKEFRYSLLSRKRDTPACAAQIFRMGRKKMRKKIYSCSSGALRGQMTCKLEAHDEDKTRALFTEDEQKQWTKFYEHTIQGLRFVRPELHEPWTKEVRYIRKEGSKRRAPLPACVGKVTKKRGGNTDACGHFARLGELTCSDHKDQEQTMRRLLTDDEKRFWLGNPNDIELRRLSPVFTLWSKEPFKSAFMISNSGFYMDHITCAAKDTRITVTFSPRPGTAVRCSNSARWSSMTCEKHKALEETTRAMFTVAEQELWATWLPSISPPFLDREREINSVGDPPVLSEAAKMLQGAIGSDVATAFGWEGELWTPEPRLALHSHPTHSSALACAAKIPRSFNIHSETCNLRCARAARPGSFTCWRHEEVEDETEQAIPSLRRRFWKEGIKLTSA